MKYTNYKTCFTDVVNNLKREAYDILIKEIHGSGDEHIRINECIYYLECNINEYEKSPDDFYDFLSEFIGYYSQFSINDSKIYYFYNLLLEAAFSVKRFKKFS